MAIYSCDHGDTIVVHQDKGTTCALCRAETKVEELQEEVDDLKSRLSEYE